MRLELPVRKATLMFYLALTFLLLAAIIIIVSVHSQIPEHHVDGNALFDVSVILDPGHGGLDSGAVSKNDVAEAPITLAISKKTQLLFRFFGISALMTREDENSLGYNPSASMRENKNADLQGRLKISERYPESLFISVHLNKFHQSKYYGAQVFYGTRHPDAKELADALQRQMVALLDPQNTRVAKLIPGKVYLMEQVRSPAVTVECGFLSNPQEEQLLKSEVYQRKIAIALIAGFCDYQKGS